MELNLKGAAVFLLVNRGDSKGRQVDNVLSIVRFFLDLDDAPLEPVMDAPIGPHIVVEPSQSRYQSFWKIEPISVTDDNRTSAKTSFERLESSSAQRFEGDYIVKLPRIVRHPFLIRNRGYQ